MVGLYCCSEGGEEQETEPDTPCSRCMYDGRGLPECNYCDIHNDYMWFRKKEDDDE